MAAEEEELRKWRQTRAAYRMIFYAVALCALVFGWDHLPDALTGAVAEAWKSVKAAFNSTN